MSLISKKFLSVDELGSWTLHPSRKKVTTANIYYCLQSQKGAHDFFEAMAKQAYSEVMSQYGNRILPPNHRLSIFVSNVAKRIVRISGMDDLKWEFYVIDSPEKK